MALKFYLKLRFRSLFFDLMLSIETLNVAQRMRETKRKTAS